jgi:hypothetical protein
MRLSSENEWEFGQTSFEVLDALKQDIGGWLYTSEEKKHILSAIEARRARQQEN